MMPEGRSTQVSVSGRSAPLSKAEVVEAVKTVLAGEHRDVDVSVAFLGRERMQALHTRWKGIDRPTDVLAFTLSDAKGGTVGDIYICPWVARREATARAISVREELLRLVVHGTLHILGYDHPERDRGSSVMWRRQERWVKALR